MANQFEALELRSEYIAYRPDSAQDVVTQMPYSVSHMNPTPRLLQSVTSFQNGFFGSKLFQTRVSQ